jgi:uncharacterized protein
MSPGGQVKRAFCAILLLVAACGSRSKPTSHGRTTVPEDAPITMALGAGCSHLEECRIQCMEMEVRLPAACRRYGQFRQPSSPGIALELYDYACRNRDGKGCTLAGKMYDDDDTGVPQDNELAAQYYGKGCRLRDGEGCEALGWAYKLGDGAPVDETVAADNHRAAAHYYKLACDGGIAEDCNGLGEMVRVGLMVEEDAARAAALFERSCKLGSSAGCRNLALHGGGKGVDRACTSNAPEACCELGHRYEHGRGVEVDLARAALLYQSACDAGNGRGCDLHGYLWEHGLGVAQDYPRAVELYQQACGDGLVVGCYDLGRMYQHGLGVTQDDQRAVDIFEETCGDGTGPGCHSLAYMYQHGRGVSQSVTKALLLYDKSCNHGEMEGCLGQAELLEFGRGGIAVDAGKARSLVKYACDHDYGPACYHLGKWALIGDMVPLDGDRAKAMFTKACDLGHQDSCKAKQDLDQAFLPAPTH